MVRTRSQKRSGETTESTPPSTPVKQQKTTEKDPEDSMEDQEYDYDEDLFDDDDDEDVAAANSDVDDIEVDEEVQQQDELLQNQFFTQEDMETEMKSIISEVEGVLEVSPGVCRILLQKYKWNKETLTDRFYESTDATAFLTNANVLAKRSQEAVTGGESECEICCDVGELSSLECNHMACRECWKAYLTEKIRDGQCEIECLAADCKLLIDEEKIVSYITDPSVVTLYRRAIVNHYVDVNTMLKWCPGVDCGKAVRVTHTDSQLITCSCGCRFCFACCEDFHEPITCRQLKLWQKRCSDDSETFNWISANTKDCPKCSVAIEKNGGCNHMRCTNKKCNFSFCWNCMESLTNHRSCNTYQGSAGQENRDKSRASLERYLFYFNRYAGHLKSLELEETLKEKVKVKMDELQNLSGMSWIEVQFLPQALEALSICRRTMMYSYAFAFYLKRDNNSMIFEANQNDLENATEVISGFLERDLEDENVMTLKQKVQDKCRYMELRRRQLLDHCTEGQEKDMWKFIES